MKRTGVSAAATFASPPPARSTGASTVRAVSAQAVAAVETSADLTCAGVQPGCRWSRIATAPVTCGADMLVPSKTANGPPAPFRVEERICPPGAARSGLSRCSNGVSPAEEKLVTTPPRPVCSSCVAWPTRMPVRPPWAARKASSRAPSRSETIPPGTASRTGITLASPERLSIRIRPTAPAAFARAAFDASVQTPRWARATVPVSEPAGSVPAPVSTLALPPQSLRSTGLPSVPTIEPTSTSVWSLEPQAGGAFCVRAPEKGIPCSEAGAPAVTTSSAVPKTWSFESAATEIASGAVPGEPTEPRP